MVRAELEPLVSVIRVWEDDKSYGDPYEWVATVRHLDLHTVEILGYVKPLTKESVRAIHAALDQVSIKSILSVTYPEGSNGPPRKKIRTVKPLGSDPGLTQVQDFYDKAGE